MHTLRQSHKLDSPELIAIAQINKKGEAYMHEGMPYQLADWDQRGNRVLVTLIPFGADCRAQKNKRSS